MAQERIQHARSSIAGAVPAAVDVKVGELIINFADRTLRTKNGANALIRMNQNIYVSAVSPADPVEGDAYLDATGKLWVFADFGVGGVQWNVISPAEDLSGYLLKSGGTMTGQLTLLGGGAGAQAISVSEAAALATAAAAPMLPKAGGVMTGQITLPGGGGASQALTATEIQDLIDLAIPPDLTNVLLKTGGTMTGQITLPGGGAGNQAATVNELAAAVASHAAQPDPHTAYTLTTELNAFIAGHVAVGGAQHPDATISVAGFMSAADKVKVDALPALVNESFLFALSDEVTAIAAGVAKLTIRMPYAFTLTAVKISLTTAASALVTTVDINENGVTILSTKLTIDVGEKTSATAAIPAVISDAALAADAEITFDIDIAGTGAKGLKVYLIGHQ